MPCPRPLFRYLIALLAFLALDAVWLGVIADGFYQQRIGHLLGEVNWLAAILFYLVYIGGILHFAVSPALARQSGAVAHAGGNGALLGGLAYATYDLTNLATLAGWPVDMVIIDILWGMFLTATVAAVTCALSMRFRLA